MQEGRKEGRKEGVTSCSVKVQGSGGTGGWKESLLVHIQRWELKQIASNKMRDNWKKIAQYLIKYKQKWERAVKKSDKRDEMRESDEDKRQRN
jgi:hypothetical protein